MQRADDSFSGAFSAIRFGNLDSLVAGLGQMEASLGLANAKAPSFAPTTPVVVPPMSLRVLERLLAASNVAAAEAEAANWTMAARALDESVMALFEVKNSFSTSMETAWVQRGDAHVNKIQRAGNVYARRADAMSAHTTALGSLASAETVMAAVAATAAMALPPAMRPAYEAQYLAVFAPRATSQLAATVPSFAQLLPDLDQLSGNPFDIREVNAPDAPSFERSPLPKIIQESFRALGHADLARATTPNDVINAYGKVNPDVVEAIKAGATQTQAASLAAPSIPPSLTPGAGMAGGAPGNLASGGVGSGPGLSTMSPGSVGSNAASASAAGGGAPAGGVAGGAGSFGGGSSRGQQSHRGALSAGRAGGAASGLAAGIGAGGIAGGQAGGIGAGGLGMGGFASGAPLAGPGMGAGAGTAPGTQGRATAFAGGPMGIAGAGQSQQGKQRKAAKVQAVTSAVERDGNLRALLGEAPLVLPSVIGNNVRE
ncbi:hypothetical protein [Corynebacterium riegelii]|uniref:hypothetical protein n=1 Tax=Corynebacterium riegelii TaxID=156976 RepID=UPI0023F26F55|nr:hypothetical protein [Corynebacterium riegelii]